jgi:hypothetical protein
LDLLPGDGALALGQARGAADDLRSGGSGVGSHVEMLLLLLTGC